MFEEITLTITEYSYLKELETWDVKLLQKDSAKVLQMKWSDNLLEDTLRKDIYIAYLKEVATMGKARGHTLESRKELLIIWIERRKKKYPQMFNKIGWWDLKVGKDAKQTS